MRTESNLLKYVLDSFIRRKISHKKVHFSKTEAEFVFAAKILTAQSLFA